MRYSQLPKVAKKLVDGVGYKMNRNVDRLEYIYGSFKDPDNSWVNTEWIIDNCFTGRNSKKKYKRKIINTELPIYIKPIVKEDKIRIKQIEKKEINEELRDMILKLKEEISASRMDFKNTNKCLLLLDRALDCEIEGAELFEKISEIIDNSLRDEYYMQQEK